MQVNKTVLFPGRYLLLCLVLMMSADVVEAQTIEPGKTVYEVHKTGKKVTIDGSLDEKVWQEAMTVALNYERYPEINADPPVQTICYITYDTHNVYIGFKANDPQPNAIRAHFMDRDNTEKLKRDDHVGITIDPFNNEQWGMQFRANPLGVQADAIYFNRKNSTDYSWDAIWESKGSITEGGYEVEIRIPFSSINTPPDSLQDWRFSAFRHYPRSVRYRIRSHPVNLDQQSWMRQFNRIKGLHDLSSGLNLKINPVLTAKRTDQNDPANAGSLNRGPLQLNPAGNVEWGIKPNLNLSATLNPDFSQIEADALRLRENRRFALSFPEKRPFFLEGSEIFETPLEAVFTRSVIKPDGGLKLTGRLGSQSFGTFLTQDQTSRLLFPANQRSQSKILNRRTYSGILRYQKQLTEKASIGILGEGRESALTEYHNYVGGVDGYLQFLRSNTLQVQYLQSTTDYSDQIASNYQQPRSTFDGTAMLVNYNHSSQKWKGRAGFTSISSGFRNDNGFFPRANVRRFRASGKRIFRADSESWYSSLQFGPAFNITTDQSGNLSDRSFSFSATYNGPLQSEVYTEYNLEKQRFGGRTFSGLSNGAFFFRVQPSELISKFRLYISYGEAVDFTNVRRSNELIIHPGLSLNMNRHLNIEINPNFQRLTYNGTPVFSTYLLGTRVFYHFNKQTFIRSVLQYRYVDRNLTEFNNPDAFNSSTESFFYQLLFSYKINPQSKLFLGYTSGYGGVNNTPLQIRSRTGYLKIGYAWVF